MPPQKVIHVTLYLARHLYIVYLTYVINVDNGRVLPVNWITFSLLMRRCYILVHIFNMLCLPLYTVVVDKTGINYCKKLYANNCCSLTPKNCRIATMPVFVGKILISTAVVL